MVAEVGDIFKNSGLNKMEYVKDINDLLDLMLNSATGNADFDMTFFELFCLGMTNICRSIYFGMDLALKIAEHKVAATESDFGVRVGHSEYDFLESYIRFLVSQNLIHTNYSDLLIDLELRELMPDFIAPLSRRGRALKDLISRREDDLVERGVLISSRNRAAQEAFVEIQEISMFPRFGRVAEVSRALCSSPFPPISESADAMADGAGQPGSEN
jgi:hypothetical protein